PQRLGVRVLADHREQLRLLGHGLSSHVSFKAGYSVIAVFSNIQSRSCADRKPSDPRASATSSGRLCVAAGKFEAQPIRLAPNSATSLAKNVSGAARPLRASSKLRCVTLR